MKTIRKPDFFVVGAPKSGTTSLYFYLKQHPQIFLPRIKELNFFCTDLHFRYPLLTQKQFMSYYEDWEEDAEKKNKTIGGEVSVWNLFSSEAAKNIHDFNPEARIIILLRNPVDMMFALHSNHVFNDNETIRNFEDALKAQDERKKGNLVSPVIKCPVEGLYYFDVATYSIQVQRCFDSFGRKNVKVILFDDLKTNVKGVYEEVLKFIGVDSSFIPNFKIYNARKTTRSKLLKAITIAPPEWMKSIGVKLFPHQTERRDWLMYWLWKINTKEVEPEKMDEDLRKKLLEQFAPEIKRLEMLIGKNLTVWLK